MKEYVLAEPGELMRLPKTVDHCVAFLGCVRKGEFTPKGTAFFVSYPCGPDNKWRYQYLVTARHVIELIRKLSDDGEIYMRINFRDMDCQVVRVANNNWVFHEDELVDVAASGVVLWDNCDHTAVKTESFATEKIIEEHSIGVGNQLFFPGLFVRHAGDKRNVPIVRMGNIAAMPTERVRTDWGNVEAYLVEARSIGGLSGSPVFVNLGPRKLGPDWWPQNETEPHEIAVAKLGPTYLLGLIHGHFGVKDALDATDHDSLFELGTRSINMGIGIVVPAKSILSIFENPLLASLRETALQRKLSEEDAKRGELD